MNSFLLGEKNGKKSFKIVKQKKVLKVIALNTRLIYF